MEPPFLVLRDQGRVVATFPFAELMQLQRAARMLMAQALSGDAASKRQVEDVFRYALDAENPDQGRAIVSVLLLKEALSEAEEYRAQQAAAQPAPAPAPPSAEETQATPAPPSNFCIHNRPVDVPCPLCEASIGRVEAA